MLRLLPHVVSKRVTTPVYLIHFLTSKCNARCPHCFIFGEGDPRFAGEALSLREIEQLTRRLGPEVYNVCLSGGETFLRPDIVEVCEAYLRNTSVQVLQLFTNGWFEERTVRCLDHLTRAYPDKSFALVISIDDLHEAHDGYRRLKNGFNRALGTYERLRDLERPNLDLDLGLTVNHQNQHRLDRIYEFLVLEKGFRTLSCTLVRGSPLDPATKEVDLASYERFCERIRRGLDEGELDCFKGFRGADLVNAKSVVMRELIPKTIAEGYQSPCYAGRLAGVVYANGDVYPCEILDKPLGNLRDHGMSLPAVWASARADAVRDFIWDSRCHCTHECFMTTNILFNPRYYPKLLWEYAKIKLKPDIPKTRGGSAR
ncbi:MAG TPA: radical SAM protein [Polyangiaceae bacterium]|jgi:MoaA/NifB/PqqE/SkfB family radical SAM enzyme|nr:radical SAM protein [Polyangiaceae bacterium]